MKERAKATGFDNTTLVELALVRELLSRQRITKAELEAMANTGGLKDTTVAELRRSGTLR